MVGFLGNTVDCPIISSILPVTPVQCGPVQIRNVPEHTAHQEVLLDEPDEPFYLTFGKGVPGLAELRAEADRFHKCLVILLLYGISLEIPVENHTFHIVSENVWGDTHAGKAVDHADEQVLLLGIGEELHIPLPAVVADHGEAGDLIFAAVIVCYPGEASVHLKGLSGLRSEPLTPASLGSHQLPFGRHKEAVGRDIVLDRGQSTGIACLLKPLQAYLSVGNTLDKELVQNGRVAGEYRLSGLTALQTVGLERKVILLESAQLRPGDPGASLQLC